MLDQLVPSQERFVAHLAHVVLGGEMDFLVVDQPDLDLESFATNVAHERLVRVMRLPVYVYGTVAGTGITTHVAFEQRLLQVGAFVRREAQLGRVRVATQVTHKRLLAGVYANVRHKRRVAGRGQVAVRAREHAAVLAHMRAERVLGLTSDVAYVTAERLLGVERVLVDLQSAVRQEHLSASGTAELFRHVIMAGPIVVGKVTEPRELHIAKFACVYFRLEPSVVLSVLGTFVL